MPKAVNSVKVDTSLHFLHTSIHTHDPDSSRTGHEKPSGRYSTFNANICQSPTSAKACQSTVRRPYGFVGALQFACTALVVCILARPKRGKCLQIPDCIQYNGKHWETDKQTHK